MAADEFGADRLESDGLEPDRLEPGASGSFCKELIDRHPLVCKPDALGPETVEPDGWGPDGLEPDGLALKHWFRCPFDL